MPPRTEPQHKSHPADSPQAASFSFEEGLSQLAEIVNRLEGGGLGLSESIAAYERGVTILRGLHEELARVEHRIHVLTAVDPQGRPSTAPYDAAGDLGRVEDEASENGSRTGARRPAARRAAPRSTGQPPTLPGMDEPPAEA